MLTIPLVGSLHMIHHTFIIVRIFTPAPTPGFSFTKSWVQEMYIECPLVVALGKCKSQVWFPWGKRSPKFSKNCILISLRIFHLCMYVPKKILIICVVPQNQNLLALRLRVQMNTTYNDQICHIRACISKTRMVTDGVTGETFVL